MLLTITNTQPPAAYLGYLPHKNPARLQSFDLSFGRAHVFTLKRTMKVARPRSRGLGRKRSPALREFALGLEALERFVEQEPLRRVHECVFGVLALESEPVDPRL